MNYKNEFKLKASNYARDAFANGVTSQQVVNFTRDWYSKKLALVLEEQELQNHLLQHPINLILQEYSGGNTQENFVNLVTQIVAADELIYIDLATFLATGQEEQLEVLGDNTTESSCVMM